MNSGFSLGLLNVCILFLAAFLGLELVRRVSPLLHTPLMSLTNAISAISVVGGIMIVGSATAPHLSSILGFVAIVAATLNIVAGFMITDRMLKMFRRENKGGKR